MASVRVTGGTIERRGLLTEQRRGGALYSAEDKAPSPSGSSGVVNITTDVSCFAGGTATGGVDHYTLGDGTEGHEKELLMCGTGEAVIDYNGTATRITLTEPDDRVGLVFIEGKWRQMRNTASAEAVAAGDPHYASHDITHTSELPIVSGERALGAGDGVVVDGDETVAFGVFASATGSRSVAIGVTAETGGDNAVAVGTFAQANADATIAIGWDAAATETFAIAIGQGSEASANSGIAFGVDADANGVASLGIGLDAVANAGWDIAIGASAFGGGGVPDVFDGSIVIGANSECRATTGVILGPNLQLASNQDNCTRLGGSGALILPLGTTAQRTSGATEGMIRFNTDLAELEYYDGSTWKQVATA